MQFLKTLVFVGYTWADPTEANTTLEHGNPPASCRTTFGMRANSGKDRWQNYISKEIADQRHMAH